MLAASRSLHLRAQMQVRLAASICDSPPASALGSTAARILHLRCTDA
jgi:hypothetical protein